MFEPTYPYNVYGLDVLERLLWIDSCSSEEAAFDVLWDVRLFHPAVWITHRGRTVKAMRGGWLVRS